MGYEVKPRTNGIYYVEFVGIDGNRKRVSLGTRDPKAAEVMGRDKYLDHFRAPEQQPGGPAPALNTTFTLSDAFEKMKQGAWHPDSSSSWPTIWSDCKILLAALGNVEVTAIQSTELQAFVDRCRADGLAPGTIKKRLSRLRTVMQKCATGWINPKTKRPYLPYVPEFPVIGGIKPRKVELSEEDERRVYAYCDEQRTGSARGQQWWLFKQFIMWQIDTGMRKGESLTKPIEDIDGDVVVLHDDETKNSEGREVVLTTRLQKMIALFRGMDIKGPMFAGLTVGKVYEMWDGPVAAIIDKVIPDKGARDKAKLELLQLQGSQALAEIEARLSAIVAEANSRDPWTSRARPSFLYVMYLLILWALPMGVIAAFRPDTAQAIASGMTAYLSAMPEALYALFGTGYLGYTAARQWGKVAGSDR